MLVTQSCPTFFDPMDCSPPGSSVHGILQARILEWVVIPSPGDLPDPGIEPRSPALQADSLPSEPLKGKVKSLSRVQLFATPWTLAYWAPPSMGFSGQRYWSGLSFPSPGDLPDPGIEPCISCITGGFFTTEPPGKTILLPILYY